jgi:rSAM/selenodomain-associated transferase 1
MSGSKLIVVYTKPAVPGSVKTRLVPPFTAEQAAEFHLAALADVVGIAGRAAARVELHVAGDDDDAGEYRALYPELEVFRQADGELGERMKQAFDDCFQRGFDDVLILGSDHPTLPIEFLAAAFAHLGDADLALGPSQDGGYYCVAVRRASWPAAAAVFHDIPWSGPDVLVRSLERARAAGLTVALAPEWYDVDRPEDLERVGRDAPPASAARRYLKEMWRRSGGCCST